MSSPRSLILSFCIFFICIIQCKSLNAVCYPNIDFDEWESNSPSSKDYTLIQSNVYIRHGDRTQWQPIPCFKGPQQIWNCSQTTATQPMTAGVSNSYSSFSFQFNIMNGSNVLPGNCKIGQLTSIGYNQQLAHGQSIKKRYSDTYDLLPNSFSNSKTINNQILVRSDDSPRVQQSAMAFFEGMYANLENKPAETFVIPFETGDAEFQIMTPNENVCPYLREIRSQMEASLDYQTRYDTFTIPLLAQAQKFMAPVNVTENNLFDCGTVYGCHNKTVPDGFTQSMYDMVNEDTGWYGMYAAQYPDYINATKYNNGPFLKLVYSRIYSAVMSDMKNGEVFDDDNGYKMYLYGGHDSGIVPIIGALGYNITEWVPYADIVTFELFKRKADGEYFVLMSYNGEILKPGMCDCESNEYSLCSWSKFQDFMNKVTPTQSECPGMRNVPSMEELMQKYESL